MTAVFGRFVDVPLNDFRLVTEVTYIGYVKGTLAALERMLPRDRGVIVQVGSALAYRAIPLQAAYCGAKFAIRGFTEALRAELMHDGSGVRVSMVQLPAVNTPQFDTNPNRMPHRPMPVPPIYQPEVAAEAVVWAATHRRRLVYVGWSTVATVWASRLAPGLVDRYLGRTGYASQQTDASEDPGRPDNLMRPVEGDRGAHGDFDARAKRRTVQLWLTTHRSQIGVAVLVVAIAAGRRRAR
jgi:short-subunit dehydrogenase